MASDWDLVSKEDHELEYILDDKYGKRTTQENKNILCDIIDDFKANSNYSPYHHSNLYKYFEDKPHLLNFLEDKT